MDIERLSALVQSWREIAEKHDARAERLNESGDASDAAWCEAAAEHRSYCADELATLIAELGQEVGAVAPLAMRIVLPRGSTTGWESYDAERAANLSKGWTVELAYSSPAHTSEARDAARYRWLRENVRWEPMPRDTSGAVYLVATMVSAVYGNCNDQTDEAIDAAIAAEAK